MAQKSDRFPFPLFVLSQAESSTLYIVSLVTDSLGKAIEGQTRD